MHKFKAMNKYKFIYLLILRRPNSDIYKSSFFPQAIRDWHSLPDSLLSAAECAEASVAKFTSLARARV